MAKKPDKIRLDGSFWVHQDLRGGLKTMEEMGEAIQAICKLSGIIPDKALKAERDQNLSDELTDVEAVIAAFRKINGIPRDKRRFKDKLDKFTTITPQGYYRIEKIDVEAEKAALARAEARRSKRKKGGKK